ncbi:hypothetical protein [Reticulibacter mediterranei]|nr:hypothetical protein [Reticulibacter mediterranei]
MSESVQGTDHAGRLSCSLKDVSPLNRQSIVLVWTIRNDVVHLAQEALPF